MRERLITNHRSTGVRLTRALVLICSLAPAGAGLAQDAPAEPTPPPSFSTIRADEDWSKFDPALSDDPWADLKHIRLNDDGSHWLSVGGHARLRVESWHAFGFNDVDANEDTFLLGRLLAHADLHLGDGFRVFVEGKSAFSTDRDLPGGRRTLDVDVADLQNAFADLRLSQNDDMTVTTRLGRQELLFGKQRLVSPLPWGNTKRSWDGGRVIVESGDWRIDAFYTRFAAVEKYDFNDWNPGPDFYGVYAAGAVGDEASLDLDLYWLAIDGRNATFNGDMGDETRHTLGARFGGTIGESGFDFDLEGAFQFGEVGSADVAAWAFAAEGGYTFRESAWTPRAFVAFDYASGDDSPGDGDVETFNQLFPLGHAYLGYMDFVGRQNIVDLAAGVSARPVADVTLRAALHFFWRASDDDALYNAGGGVVRAAGGSEASEVGQEIDLTLRYAADRHTSIEAGYSHFFAGNFIDDTGPSDDMDWFYLQAIYTF